MSSDYSGKGRALEEEAQVVQDETREREVSGEKGPPIGIAEGTESPSLEESWDAKDSQKEEEGGGENQEVREETWRGLVDFTRARSPVLGSFLALGNLVHLSRDRIEIGFEKDSFHYERILEKENRSQLEAICHEYLQRKAKMVISALDQGVISRGRGVLRAEGIIRNELKKPSEKRTEENPLIQEALRLFNGRIVKQ
jgi:hypothetical protein